MSAQSPSLKFLSTLICEDIRKEANGKEILIGVYAGDIVVETFPTHLSLKLWLNVFAEGPSRFPVKLRVINVDKKQAVHGEMAVKVDSQKGFASSASPPFNLVLNGEGTIKVQAKIGDGRWRTLVQKQVILKEIE